MKIFSTLVVLLLLSFCTAIPSVQAQDSEPATEYDLIVTPPTAYLRIKPGTPAVHTITLKNNGLSAIEVTPQLVDFWADGKTGQPVLSTSHTFPYLDADKTSFDPVVLQPNTTAQLMLHFAVPGSAENKEYPLSILFKGSITEEDAKAGLTPVSGIIASNLIVLVSDTATLESIFSVEDYGSRRVIDSFGELSFSPIVKNNSYAAAVASGSATISNWKGTKVAQFEISPSVVLGYATKEIQPIASQAKPEELRTFFYDAPFLLGPYTLTINLPSGIGADIAYIEHKIVIWAMPFSLLAAAAIACFALAGYYFYKKRNHLY